MKKRTKAQLLRIAKRLKYPFRSSDGVGYIEHELRDFLQSARKWKAIAGG